MKPTIAITLGDPAGIGPEIVAKALKNPKVRDACDPIVIGQPPHVPMGRSTRLAGLFAVRSLAEGLSLVRSGAAKALVTAPVSKETFRMADHGFPGHTEWLAAACKAPDAAMLMVSGPLRAILLTRHVPLKDVPKRLSPRIISNAAKLGFMFVKNFVRRGPRLVLCGLNPHAGDHGIIGTEEMKIFMPAVRTLARQGIRIDGPLPADSVFPLMAEGRYDLALAAYHDQGMIPLKLYAPDRVVNVTLGLPFIRTSPGHGTAYDIAGQNKARPGPMIEAILLAAEYVKRG